MTEVRDDDDEEDEDDENGDEEDEDDEEDDEEYDDEDDEDESRIDWKQERINEVTALANWDWDLDTLLRLQYAITHHSYDVQSAAIDALIDLAEKYPAPGPFSPVAMLIYFMPTFTATTGLRPYIFQSLCRLNSPAIDDRLVDLIDNTIRNEDFQSYVLALLIEGKTAMIEKLKMKTFSKNKTQILKDLLAAYRELSP